MYTFGKRSRDELHTCSAKMQGMAERAIIIINFSVLQGHRTKEEQNEMYRRGLSKLQWPEGKHNTKPSLAFDAAPWIKDAAHPRGFIPWNQKRYWYALAGVMIACATEAGVRLRWGGDWDRDWDLSKRDNPFMDLGHFEEIIE